MFMTNYNLIETKIFSLEELENMIPWERKVYINLYVKSMKEYAEKVKNTRK